MPYLDVDVKPCTETESEVIKHNTADWEDVSGVVGLEHTSSDSVSWLTVMIVHFETYCPKRLCVFLAQLFIFSFRSFNILFMAHFFNWNICCISSELLELLKMTFSLKKKRI